MKVMLTGGLGLIGTGLKEALEARGASVELFDLRGTSKKTFGDVRDLDALCSRVQSCDGIVHLAAVSRVIWGERDPTTCWSTNVEGTSNVLKAAADMSQTRRPWVIFASSREVYGQPERLPVSEDNPLQPINVYGRSKVAGEMLVAEARSAGLGTATVRFSNVFGSTHDHPDRVVPAFARAAASAGLIRIEGGENIFDFTWLDDVCKGLVTLCQLMAEESEGPPPIHFVTGRGTTLRELADMARAMGRRGTRVEHHPPRNFDVACFWGDRGRAEELLGWRAETSVEAGLQRLIEAFMEESDRAVAVS